jgi:hypothetical protein
MLAALARSNSVDCNAGVRMRCINAQASDKLNWLTVKCKQPARVPMELPQQQQVAIAAQNAAAEVGFDHTPTEAADSDPVLRTHWCRHLYVVTGARYL